MLEGCEKNCRQSYLASLRHIDITGNICRANMCTYELKYCTGYFQVPPVLALHSSLRIIKWILCVNVVRDRRISIQWVSFSLIFYCGIGVKRYGHWPIDYVNKSLSFVLLLCIHHLETIDDIWTESLIMRKIRIKSKYLKGEGGHISGWVSIEENMTNSQHGSAPQVRI